MLTTCRFSEFDTSAICRAMLIFCLRSSFKFYCKTCFEVLSCFSQGRRLRRSMKIMLTLILCCDAGTGYLIGTASTVSCFLIMDIILSSSNQLFFRDCCSFTSRKLYDFLQTFFCFCINLNIRNFIPKAFKYC